jgi:hypothetical protein
MSAYNTYGRRKFTTEARIGYIEARAAALTSAYTEMISITAKLERQFEAAGDTDAARIAGEWFAAALAGYRKAMRLGQKAEKHATRQRIERMQQTREDAWHRRMGWIKS